MFIGQNDKWWITWVVALYRRAIFNSTDTFHWLDRQILPLWKLTAGFFKLDREKRNWRLWTKNHILNFFFIWLWASLRCIRTKPRLRLYRSLVRMRWAGYANFEVTVPKPDLMTFSDVTTVDFLLYCLLCALFAITKQSSLYFWQRLFERRSSFRDAFECRFLKELKTSGDLDTYAWLLNLFKRCRGETVICLAAVSKLFILFWNSLNWSSFC